MIYRKAENWITTNSKRYLIPIDLKKLVEFGTINDLIQMMKNLPNAVTS